jgi:rhodanese-related sulfurtransferase
MHTMIAQDLRQEMEEDPHLLVLNVLSAEEFEEGHFPGSHNIPAGAPDFLKQVADLAGSRDRRIVVHCSGITCDASAKALQALTRAGFTNVHRFEGGMADWKKAGLPVVTGSPIHMH